MRLLVLSIVMCSSINYPWECGHFCLALGDSAANSCVLTNMSVVVAVTSALPRETLLLLTDLMLATDAIPALSIMLLPTNVM